MPTFYINPASGNDANAGTSWATAWQTITSGATAARIAPGDDIRVAQTPVQSAGIDATFTNGSKFVATGSTPVARIINHAEGSSGWTAAPNITIGSDTFRKFGSNSLRITPAAAFTTGKVCHALVAGVGPQNFSAFTKISFWMRFASGVGLAANTYKICLCSDTNGDVIVNEMNIIAMAATSTFHVVVLDNVTPLGSSIQSVAIYANVDPGTAQIQINNIVACNNITHETLIGPQDDCFYNVQSFQDTGINIDSANTDAGGQGWSGTTGSYPLHFITPFSSYTTATFNTLNDDGTPTGGNIVFTGGWDTATNTRTGRTAFAINHGGGTLLLINNRQYFEFRNFILARGSVPFSQTGARLYLIDNCVFCGTNGPSFENIQILSNTRFLNLTANVTTLSGTYYNCIFANTALNGVRGSGSSKFVNCIFRNSASGSFGVASFPGGTDYPGSGMALYKCLLSETTEIPTNNVLVRNIIWSYDHDQTLNNHWGFTFGGTINWQTTVKQGSDPGSWRVVHNATGRTQVHPIRFQFAQIAVDANQLVTVKAWVKKDGAATVGCRIYVQGAEYTLAGITEQSATAANNTSWQELTIQFTPTVSGIVPLWFESWYISANSNTYIGSITVTQ